MARGKYLSLEEARKDGTIQLFCTEHPSKGDLHQFDEMMDWFRSRVANSSSRTE